MRKEYLGDAVYADFDGFAIILTTEDGIRATNRIVLEPAVFTALTRYMERLQADQTAPAPPGRFSPGDRVANRGGSGHGLVIDPTPGDLRHPLADDGHVLVAWSPSGAVAWAPTSDLEEDRRAPAR